MSTTLKHRLARAVLLIGAAVVVGIEIARVSCQQLTAWVGDDRGVDDAE